MANIVFQGILQFSPDPLEFVNYVRLDQGKPAPLLITFIKKIKKLLSTQSSLLRQIETEMF